MGQNDTFLLIIILMYVYLHSYTSIILLLPLSLRGLRAFHALGERPWEGSREGSSARRGPGARLQRCRLQDAHEVYGNPMEYVYV